MPMKAGHVAAKVRRIACEKPMRVQKKTFHGKQFKNAIFSLLVQVETEQLSENNKYLIYFGLHGKDFFSTACEFGKIYLVSRAKG